MKQLEMLYSPEKYCLAIAFTGKDMFQTREIAFRKCIGMGYELPNIIHPLLTANVSPMGNCKIGCHCFIGAGSTNNNCVSIGDFTLAGANAFVKKDTEPYGVIVPARGNVLSGKKSTEFNL